MAQANAVDLAHQRRAVVTAARRWIGTPYRQRASVCGAGADCLGLLRGIWREVVGPEQIPLPAYSDDWLDLSGTDVLLRQLCKNFQPLPGRSADAGSVMAFKFGRNGMCRHVGVLSGPATALRFIHAYSRYGVVETTLDDTWSRRIAATFDFPLRST